MKALILAAGYGKNLIPFTDTRPKPMLNICGKYILENIIQQLKSAGVTDIYNVVGHKKEVIMDYICRGEEFGINVNYVDQSEPGGIGDAILKAKNLFVKGEYFILVYGDILTSSNIFAKTVQTFHSFRMPIASVCLTASTQMYGNIFMDEQMNITRIIEKPIENDLGNYVLSGVFVLPSTFFSFLEETKGDVEKAFEKLIKDGGLRASIWEDEWIDMGYPWDILRANEIVMNSWERACISKNVTYSGDVKIEGAVDIEDGVMINSGTVIVGPCYIGAGSYIGNNVLIRKYSSIGAGSVIGYGVELKNCVLFGNSKVGRLSFLGDSVIGSNVDIGSGTMTVVKSIEETEVEAVMYGKKVKTGFHKLGSFIGDNAKVGVSNTLKTGTIIRAGKMIPHNYSLPLNMETE